MFTVFKRNSTLFMLVLAMLFAGGVSELAAQNWWSHITNESQGTNGNWRWNGDVLQVDANWGWHNTNPVINRATTHTVLRREDFPEYTSGSLTNAQNNIPARRIGDGLWVGSTSQGGAINQMPANLDAPVGTRSNGWRKLANFPPLGHNVTIDLDNGSEAIVLPGKTAITQADMPPNPKKDGHRFLYWLHNDLPLSTTFSINITSPTTIKAIYRPNYAVNFELQGGQGGPQNNPDADSPLPTPTPAPTKDGYQFLGWSLTEDGAQATFPLTLGGSVTLWALWLTEGEKTYGVTFNLDGGSNGPVNIDKALPPLEKPAIIPTKEKHEFLYWSDTKNGKEIEFPLDLNSDTTLWAVWREKFQLIFNLDGGSNGPQNNLDVIQPITQEPKPIPTKSGHQFLHWSLTKDGTPVKYPLPTLTDITLWAVWEKLPNTCDGALAWPASGSFNGIPSGTKVRVGDHLFESIPSVLHWSAEPSVPNGNSNFKYLGPCQDMRRPIASDFTVNLNPREYNGQNQPISVTGANGMGTITVLYQKNGGGSISTGNVPRDVASYTIYVRVAKGNAFLASTDDIELGIVQVTPRTITVNWSTGLIYNGTAQKPIATIAGIGSDPSIITLNVTGEQSAVGTHSATATLPVPHNNNYAPTNSTANFVISPKPLNISWNKTEFTYDGTAQKPAASFSDISEIIGGEIVTISTEGEKTDIGNYTATAVLGGTHAGNYTIVAETNFAIIPKPIAIVWGENISFEYNGDVQNPSADFDDVSEIVVSDRDFVSISIEGARNAGDHTATATLTGDRSVNYVIINDNEEDRQDFVILPKPLDIAWGQQSTVFTYNGEVQGPVATFATPEQIVNPDDVSIEYEGTGIDIGNNYSATATLGGSDKGNYKISDASQKELPFVINPKEISIEWTWLELEYNGTVQTPTARLVSDVVIYERDKGTFALEYVGGARYVAGDDYNVVAITNNPNYVISEATATTVFGIVAKPIVIVWGNNELTYNGKAQTPTANFEKEDDIASDDEVIIQITGAEINASSQERVAEIKLDGKNSDNYKIISETTQKFVINPKIIAVEWANVADDGEHKGKAVFQYSGTPQPSSAKHNLSDILSADRDDFTVLISGRRTNVGADYTATASANNSNYAISDATKNIDFVILPRQLSISWSNTELTYDGTPQKPTAIFANPSGEIVGDEDVKVSVKGEKIDAGGYTATAELSGSNIGNYEISKMQITQAFVINPKEIGVEWKNLNTLVYDGKLQKPTAEFNDNDIVSDDKASFELLYSITGKTNAGSAYGISVSANNSNYVISEATANTDFAILPKPLEIQWSNVRLEYNGKAQKPTADFKSASEIVGEDIVNINVTGGKISVGQNYTAIAELDNSNYAIKEASASTDFAILPKPLTIVWNNTGPFEFDATEKAPTPSIENKGVEVIEGDVVGVQVSEKQINAGNNHTATAVLTGSDKDNYVINNAGKTKNFAITPLEIAVDWGNLNFTWNGSPQKPTATATGVGSDGIIALTIDGEKTAVGNHTATATLPDKFANNYTLESESKEAKFTIARRTLAVIWSNTNLTFNGQEQAPTAKVEGNVITLGVTGGQINAGSGLIATAILSGADAATTTLTNTQTTFSIAKKTLAVQWSNTTVISDGSPKKPTASATDGENIILLRVPEAGVSAPDVYINRFTAEFVNPTDAMNYTLTNSALSVFTINHSVSIINKKDKAIYGITLKNSVVKSGETANLTVSTPEPAEIKLVILDALGNLLNAQDLRTNSDGTVDVSWDLTNKAGRLVSAGTYVILVEAKGASGKVYNYTARIGVSK